MLVVVVWIVMVI
ncbi:hypothetical protein M0802_015375 [Mischocyttarus mexicanus]|nr:hypothetical protein M0802_015375 [Mischocyttarus mexicanus]